MSATYDAEGNLKQKSKGTSAETWVFTYDHLNHLTSAEDRPTPNGAASVHLDYKYDALGNKASATNALGQTTFFSYAGPDNALMSVTDPQGNSTHFNYNGSGELTSIELKDTKPCN